MLRGFPARVAVAGLFLPVLVALIDRGGWIYGAFVAVLVLLGAWEWWRLGRAGGGGADLLSLLAGASLAFAGGLVPGSRLAPLLAGPALVLILLSALRHADRSATRRVGHLLLGALYVGLLPAFLVRMRALPHGRELLYLTYLTAFVCDTAAYGVGRAVGRHALWPRVSPRKTWEGAAAGLLAAVGAAALARVWFAGFLGWAAIVEVGLIVGVLGQLGDLVESLWKREAGVKDSSGLIPGHGGVLDRFDNLHFVAPVLYTHLVLVHGSAGGIGGP